MSLIDIEAFRRWLAIHATTVYSVPIAVFAHIRASVEPTDRGCLTVAKVETEEANAVGLVASLNATLQFKRRVGTSFMTSRDLG